MRLVEYQELQKKRTELNSYNSTVENEFRNIFANLDTLATIAIHGGRVDEINQLKEQLETTEKKIRESITGASELIDQYEKILMEEDETAASELISASAGVGNLKEGV